MAKMVRFPLLLQQNLPVKNKEVCQNGETPVSYSLCSPSNHLILFIILIIFNPIQLSVNQKKTEGLMEVSEIMQPNKS